MVISNKCNICLYNTLKHSVSVLTCMKSVQHYYTQSHYSYSVHILHNLNYQHDQYHLPTDPEIISNNWCVKPYKNYIRV